MFSTIISSMITPKNANSSDFAVSWLGFQRSPAGTAMWSASQWVVDCYVGWTFDRPEELWGGIIEISKSELSDEEIAQLGAGPLESLLSENYPQFSQLVFHLARKNDVIFLALEHVNPPDEHEIDFEKELSDLQDG
ncbi:DUF6869 domain-containing protein [Roseovarius sp.]|uniref:DUF6869 domain-containing protein n=1 Tax=Roseovarius sp. TaxID=1486281 RepID=UPI003BAB9F96